MRTLKILQSAPPNSPDWIVRCLASVKSWAQGSGFAYEFRGDELKGLVSRALWQKVQHAPQAGFDLARLVWLTEELESSHQNDEYYGLWIDADVFVIDPSLLTEQLPWGSPFAVGRENWVDRKDQGFVCRQHVHNATLWCRKNNPVLPFYRFAAERILNRVSEPFVPQLVGPKLLTSWHNIIRFDVLECCLMLSPTLAEAILNLDEKPMQVFRDACSQGVAALNLCSSLARDDQQMQRMLDVLQSDGPQLFANL